MLPEEFYGCLFCAVSCISLLFMFSFCVLVRLHCGRQREWRTGPFKRVFLGPGRLVLQPEPDWPWLSNRLDTVVALAATVAFAGTQISAAGRCTCGCVIRCI